MPFNRLQEWLRTSSNENEFKRENEYKSLIVVRSGAEESKKDYLFALTRESYDSFTVWYYHQTRQFFGVWKENKNLNVGKGFNTRWFQHIVEADVNGKAIIGQVGKSPPFLFQSGSVT